MDENEYIVVYDILRDGIGIAPLAVFLGMFAGFVFGVVFLLALRQQRKPVGCMILWLTFWAIVSIIGVKNVLGQHLLCVEWARKGAFDVTEGPVSQFAPHTLTKRRETFVVNGITFSYSDAALADGGFRYSFGPDGDLRVGTQVRVAHREGRILKLEIRKE
jgi:hypothetical protein